MVLIFIFCLIAIVCLLVTTLFLITPHSPHAVHCALIVYLLEASTEQVVMAVTSQTCIHRHPVRILTGLSGQEFHSKGYWDCTLNALRL